MKREIQVGKTDYSAFVFILDPAQTDGSGKTGLVAANLTVAYARMETDNDATITDVTSSLNDLAALTTAHTDWGVKEVSSTLFPGLYRIDFADAVFAAGAWTAAVNVMITTSAAAPSPMEFVLVAHDPDDLGTKQSGDGFAIVNSGTHGNAALKTLIDAVDDLVDTEVALILTRLGTPADLGGGASISKNLEDIEAQTDDIGVAGAGLTAIPWNAAWDAEVQSEVDDGLVARGLDHLLNAAVAGADVADNSIFAKLVSKSATADWDDFVNTTDSLQALRDNMPANFAALVISAGGIVGADLVAISGDTGAADNLEAAFDGTGGVTLSVVLGTGAIVAASIGGDAFTAAKFHADVSTEFAATAGARQITEGYAAVGAAPTLDQFQSMVLAILLESSISGTTQTWKKLDQSTTAMTGTLDDATDPASLTRAT